MKNIKKFGFGIILFVILTIGVVFNPTFSKAAVTWVDKSTVNLTAGNGLKIGISSDASKIIAGVHSGRLYTSVDSGNTWVETQPAGNTNKFWNTVASDADGSFLMAASESGRLYVSSDSGATWAEKQPAGNTDKNWLKVVSDSTGTNLIAAENRLYTSSDGGVSWTERQPAGNILQIWNTVAADSDGSNIIVGNYGGRLYTSSNFGVTWTERTPAGNANKNWVSVSSDADGSNLIAAIDGGNVYTSTNGGVNWTQRIPGGFSNQNWSTTASSSNGTTLLVAKYSREYISKDGGVTWENVLQYDPMDWVDSAVSSDGSISLINSRQGFLFIGSDFIAPIVAALSPAPQSTNVASKDNLVVAFDEIVRSSSGADNNIIIKKSSDNSIIETIPANNRKVTGSGTTTITINPSATLSEATEYYVEVGQGAFVDTAGNTFNGILDSTSWKFKTASSVRGKVKQ